MAPPPPPPLPPTGRACMADSPPLVGSGGGGDGPRDAPYMRVAAPPMGTPPRDCPPNEEPSYDGKRPSGNVRVHADRASRAPRAAPPRAAPPREPARECRSSGWDRPRLPELRMDPGCIDVALNGPRPPRAELEWPHVARGHAGALAGAGAHALTPSGCGAIPACPPLESMAIDCPPTAPPPPQPPW